MKRLLLLVGIFLSLITAAQRHPQCNDLAVEQIKLDTGWASITVSNSCTNCFSGPTGCSYNELQIIRTIAPYDTLVRSACWCFNPPGNSSSFTYKVPSSVAMLPPLGQVRVSFLPTSCGCDAIPFSPTLLAAINTPSISVFPNPTTDFITIQTPDKIPAIAIKDVTGMLVFQQKNIQPNTKINISGFSSGVYLFHAYNSDNQIEHTLRIIKL